MIALKHLKAKLSFVREYHYRLVFTVAILWTTIDLLFWLKFMNLLPEQNTNAVFELGSTKAIVLRGIIVFIMSCLMGYLLIFKLRQVFRNYPLFVNLLAKTAILLSGALVMNFILHVAYSAFILNYSASHSIDRFVAHASSVVWLFKHSIGWIFLFLLTQIVIEVNEKYSPGVFWDILIGRYIEPKVQKRIVMFIDLHDSTPIAERLGSKQNFRFIRDFIYHVSVALLEFDGRIYQYVGDEIVVSWLYTPQNVHKCLDALALSSRLLQRNGRYFRQHYDLQPEFKAGIHVGEVTVGEIGIVKKDIAMSGDTMNTAARIRSSCSELEHKYIASKELLDNVEIGWQTISLGTVDLKGKNESMELIAIKI
jgi:adenylate cyclase